MEQLTNHRRKMFGASSEKSVYADGVQLGLFDDGIISEIVSFEAEIESESAVPQKHRPKKRGELGARLPRDIPIETVEHELPADGCSCPECGQPMHSIGKEVARRDLKLIPAKAVVIEHVRHSYSCRNCVRPSNVSDDLVPIIIKADLPPQVIKGSLCAPETVAHIAVQKCVMGSPLYRQEQEWERNGIPLKRQTMANWMIKCSEDYLEPIYDELHRRLCQHRFLHSDGTTFQVLREPGKTPQSESCMWIYRTSGDTKHPIVLYEYQPDKTMQRPKEFLKGFSGCWVGVTRTIDNISSAIIARLNCWRWRRVWRLRLRVSKYLQNDSFTVVYIISALTVFHIGTGYSLRAYFGKIALGSCSGVCHCIGYAF